MALWRIPFGSACRNDALEKRYFPNFDDVLVERGFAATGVADDDGTCRTCEYSHSRSRIANHSSLQYPARHVHLILREHTIVT